MKIIDWHAGFVSAMKLELREYEDRLVYEEEYYLANRAQKLDLLIINNKSGEPIDNPIGSIFSRHNILEYKGVGDTLTYGAFYKTLAYTSLYLYEMHKDDVYSAKDYTMTFVRNAYPRKLFKQLKRDGLVCSERILGIYDVMGMQFRTQIIVSRMLPLGIAIWLRSLTRKGTVIDVENITAGTFGLDKKHKDYADNVMDVFANANRDVMVRIKKEESPVCKAINELFADEARELKAQLEQKDAQIAQQNIELKDLRNASEENIRLKSLLAANNIAY